MGELVAPDSTRLAPLPARWPLWLVAALPRHSLSRLAGTLVGVRWPSAVQRWLNRGFCRLFHVDASESAHPIEGFACLQELFTRELRHGVRPVAATPRTLVSPVDAAVGACGLVLAGQLLQIKGKSYGVDELLGGGELAQRFAGGSYATLYLSPRDYHRIHAPVAGRVVAARYLPGGLWPVNPRAVAHVDKLFARNERLVTFLSSELGEVAVVAVGATMVGKTRVVYDDLATNSGATAMVERRYDDGAQLAAGAELGRFEFGSTVVLVCANPALRFDSLPERRTVRMGEAIACLDGAAP